MSSITGENTLTFAIIAIIIMAVLLGVLAFFTLNTGSISTSLISYIPFINSSSHQPAASEQPSPTPTPSATEENTIKLSPQEVSQLLGYVPYPVEQIQYRDPNIFVPVYVPVIISSNQIERCNSFTIPQNRINCLNELQGTR